MPKIRRQVCCGAKIDSTGRALLPVTMQSRVHAHSRTYRRRTHLAHVRQSRADLGLGFATKGFKIVFSSLGSGPQICRVTT